MGALSRPATDVQKVTAILNTPDCGTYASYVRGCKCDACRAANAAYMRAYRLSRRGAPRERAGHGTRACYVRGCRQLDCVEANNAYMRLYKKRTR